MKPLLFFIFFIPLFSTNVIAQQLTNATGATIKSSQYIIEYSVGEISITTINGAGKDVTQGLLQPALKVQDPGCDIINTDLKYFENPARDKLSIVGFHDWIKSYQVFSADGRLIRYQPYYNNHINVSGLPAAGMYYIRLLPGCNGQYKILKFIKQ